MKATKGRPRVTLGRLHKGRIVVVVKREDGVIEVRFPESVRPYGKPQGAA